MVKYHSGFLNTRGLKTPIVHCIARDRACGAGFATQIPERHLKKLRAQQPQEIGGFHVTTTKRLDGVPFTIVHLVTKARSSDKPEFADFARALFNFNNWAAEQGMKTWYCPQMGAGLDRLPWSTIAKILDQLPLEFNVFVPEDNPIPVTK